MFSEILKLRRKWLFIFSGGSSRNALHLSDFYIQNTTVKTMKMETSPKIEIHS
jgi:hypothetical protein